jgi:hypothetical protein
LDGNGYVGIVADTVARDGIGPSPQLDLELVDPALFSQHLRLELFGQGPIRLQGGLELFDLALFGP